MKSKKLKQRPSAILLFSEDEEGAGVCMDASFIPPIRPKGRLPRAQSAAVRAATLYIEYLNKHKVPVLTDSSVPGLPGVKIKRNPKFTDKEFAAAKRKLGITYLTAKAIKRINKYLREERRK